jgi:hypothetical protein
MRSVSNFLQKVEETKLLSEVKRPVEIFDRGYKNYLYVIECDKARIWSYSFPGQRGLLAQKGYTFLFLQALDFCPT